MATEVLEGVLDPCEGIFPWFCLDADRRKGRSRRGAECEEPIGMNSGKLWLLKETALYPRILQPIAFLIRVCWRYVIMGTNYLELQEC